MASIALAFLLPNISAVDHWDQAVVQGLAGRRSVWGIRLAWFFSYLGDTPSLILVLAGIGLWFCLRKRYWLALYFVCFMTALKLGISLLKILVNRPRPAVATKFMDTLSMPSGHAANAIFIFALLAWILLQRKGDFLWKAHIVILCLVGALGVEWSRAYLGLHYPTDLFVGTLYTASGTWLGFALAKGRLSLT